MAIENERIVKDVENGNVILKDLPLVVTHRCQIGDCLHCARGNPRPDVMEKDVVNALFAYFQDTESVSILGGEPALAPQTIEYVYDAMEKHNAFPQKRMVMVSNGVVFPAEVYEIIEAISSKTQTDIYIADDEFHDMQIEKKFGLTPKDIQNQMEAARKKYPTINFYRRTRRGASNAKILLAGHALANENILKEKGYDLIVPDNRVFFAAKQGNESTVLSLFTADACGNAIPCYISNDMVHTHSLGRIENGNIPQIIINNFEERQSGDMVVSMDWKKERLSAFKSTQNGDNGCGLENG